MPTLARVFMVYLETLLELIEDQEDLQLPIGFDYTLISIFFFQCVGYIYTNFEAKPLYDQKASLFARIGELSSGTFLLFFFAHDTLSIMVLVFMNFALIFYYVYVGFIIYMKSVFPIIYFQLRSQLKKMNKVINILLTFYWWVFSVPFLEINIGVILCGPNAFLKSDRNKDYDVCEAEKPLILTIFTSIGIGLSFLTGGVIIVFYRNYKFNEENKLKRRFRPINSLIQFSIRTGVMITYYIGTLAILPYRHILAHTLSVTILYDLYFNYPFSNRLIIKFYKTMAIAFQVLLLMASLWQFTDYIEHTTIFYDYFLMTILVVYLADILHVRCQDRIMLHFGRSKHTLQYTDFYTEQLCQIAEEGQTNLSSRMLLLYYLNQHKEVCRSPTCLCRNVDNPIFRHQKVDYTHQAQFNNADEDQGLINQIEALQMQRSLPSMANSMSKQSQKTGDMKNDTQLPVTTSTAQKNQEMQQEKRKREEFINFTQFYRFLTGILKGALDEPSITKSQTLSEQLSLKYISFLAKYRNNAVRSYYELKLLAQKSSLTFYFTQLEKILSQKLQQMIQQQQIIGRTQEEEDDEQNLDSKFILQKFDGFEHRRNIPGGPTFDIPLLMEMELHFEQWTQIMLTYLKQKDTFWVVYQKGVQSLREIQNQAEEIMQALTDFERAYNTLLDKKSEFGTASQTNMMHHKMQQITCLIVRNDYQKALAAEKLLIDCFHKDQIKDFKDLSVLKYMTNEVVVMNVSLMKKKGHFLNKKTQKLADFFGFPLNEFQKINTIDQFMPASIAGIHHHLVDRYMKRGYSNIMMGAHREVFMQNGRNYVEQVKVQLSTYFESDEDFTQLGSLLKINHNKDFILFDKYGNLLGISEHIFIKIREKYLLLNESKDDSTFTLQNFLAKTTIFMLFPDLVDVFRDLVKSILNGKLEDHPESVIDELLQARVNELIVVKDQRSHLIVSKNLLQVGEQFHTEIEEMKHSPEHASQKSRRAKGALLAAFKSKRVSLMKVASRIKDKVQARKSHVDEPLSLLYGPDLVKIKQLLTHHAHVQLHAKAFKYFTKLDIKCHILAQQVMYSPNEIYFVIQLNDQKISKEALCSLFEMKSIITERLKEADDMFDKQISQQIQNTEELKLQQRGIYKTVVTLNITQDEDDDALPIRKVPKQIGQITQSEFKSQHLTSQNSMENDSENQIEEDITLNSSRSQADVQKKDKSIQIINDNQSMSSTTTKSYMVSGQYIIKNIIGEGNRDAIARQFIAVNLYLMVVFMIFFVVIQVYINQEFSTVVSNLQVESQLRTLNQLYGRLLLGGLLNFYLNQLGILKMKDMQSLKNYTQLIQDSSFSLMNGTFSPYKQILANNYDTVLQQRDLVLQVKMPATVYKNLTEEIGFVEFFQLIQDQIHELDVDNPKLSLPAFYCILQNHQLHHSCIQLLINSVVNDMSDYVVSRSNILQILTIFAAVMLLVPIALTFLINRKLNKYFSLILNLVTRITLDQCVNQKQIVVKTMQILNLNSDSWSTFDFKEMYLGQDEVVKKQDVQVKSTFNYSLLNETINTNKISAVYGIISLFFVTFYVTSFLVYSSINSNMQNNININSREIGYYSDITSYILNSEIYHQQSLLSGAYGYFKVDTKASLQADIQESLTHLSGFVENNIQGLSATQPSSDAYLKQLLIGQLCSLSDESDQREVCADDNGRQYFQYGVTGIISQLLKYQNTYFDSEAYYSNYQHLFLYWLGLPIIDWSFTEMISTTTQMIINYCNAQFGNLQIIWYLVGFIGLLGQIIIGTWLYYRIKTQIRNHKLMLTLLPFTSLQENSTLHLLKQLQQFV